MVSYIKTLAQYALVVSLGLSAAACATLPEPSSPMAIGVAAQAPRGYTDFCQRQPDDCAASPAEAAALPAEASPDATAVSAVSLISDVAAVSAGGYDGNKAFAAYAASRAIVETPVAAAPSTLELTPALWAKLTATNDRINRAIGRRTDLEAYGVQELWSLPLQDGVAYGDCEDYVLEKRRALLAAGLPRDAMSIAVVTTPKGERHAVLLVETAAGAYVLDNLSAYVLPWAKTGYRWRERQVAGSATQWAMARGDNGVLLLASLR